MNDIRILACIPVYEAVEPMPLINFLALSQESGYAEFRGEYALKWMIGGPHINTSIVRNQAANLAMDNNATHLLFMDGDMVPPQDMVSKLLARDVDIIVPLFFKSGNSIEPCIYDVDELGTLCPMYSYPRDSIFECPGGAGTGVMLIKTGVLKAVGYPVFAPGFNEDIKFCKRARELGFPTWCDSSVKVSQMSLPQPIGESDYNYPKGLTALR